MLKPKRKWTKEEEDALHAGVEKHGVSNWKFILSDSHFSSSLANRSNVDLKDKWRNLSRAKDRDLLNNRETAKIPSGIDCYEVDSEPLARFHGDAADQENKTKTTNKVGSDAADQENKTRKTNQVSSEPLARFGGDAADQENKTRTTNKVGSKPLARFGGDAADQEDKTRTTNVTTYRRKKRRRKKIVKEEDDSDSQDRDSEEYYNPRKISRQQRGARCKTVNQAKKLTCEQVHSYLENLWLSFPEDKKSSCTHLDPLWYTFYSSGSNKQKVLKWIKKRDIFSRKYVFFPIVQWGHWSVLIFCHFGESLVSKLNTPCILLLDSLAKADHSNQLEPNIRKFVLDIYNNAERTEDIGLLRKMPFLVPKVPQQRDSEECGFFVLYYIKLFVENAPESFSITNGYPYFMKKDWFSFEGLDSFRKTLVSSHV